MKCRALIVALIISLLPSCGSAKVVHYGVRVVKEYPHDRGSYTQGLFFHDGNLYESTGQWGSSTFRTVDLETGKPLTRMDFARKYFVEGSVILGDELYILTWTNKVAFKYDAKTLKYKSTVGYPREGWGLTTDGKQLISSDGSSNLYFMDPSMKVVKKLKVTLDGRAVRYLNELEWIDGKIWANVYTTDTIVIINPNSGVVEATVNCSGLMPEGLRDGETDVLNGIAVLDGRIFLTGKNWPRMYEIELIKK